MSDHLKVAALEKASDFTYNTLNPLLLCPQNRARVEDNLFLEGLVPVPPQRFKGL